MRVRFATISSLVLSLVAVATAGQTAPVYGGATPQEVVASLQKAVKSNDFLGAVPFISPDGRKELANEGVTGVIMVLAFSDPDDPIPGGKPLAKAELDAKRKSYRAAMDLAKATLKPHGLDAFIGKPAMSAETQGAIDAAISKADTVALVTSLMGAMVQMGPMLRMSKKGEGPKLPFTLGNVTDYKITGDKATAKNGAEAIDFVRVGGRWFMTPPKSGGGK